MHLAGGMAVQSAGCVAFGLPCLAQPVAQRGLRYDEALLVEIGRSFQVATAPMAHAGSGTTSWRRAVLRLASDRTADGGERYGPGPAGVAFRRRRENGLQVSLHERTRPSLRGHGAEPEVGG